MPFKFSTPPFATDGGRTRARRCMTRTKRARRLALLRLSYSALARSHRPPTAFDRQFLTYLFSASSQPMPQRRRTKMSYAAFLAQPHREAAALRVYVLHLHAECSADEIEQLQLLRAQHLQVSHNVGQLLGFPARVHPHPRPGDQPNRMTKKRDEPLCGPAAAQPP